MGLAHFKAVRSQARLALVVNIAGSEVRIVRMGREGQRGFCHFAMANSAYVTDQLHDLEILNL